MTRAVDSVLAGVIACGEGATVEFKWRDRWCSELQPVEVPGVEHRPVGGLADRCGGPERGSRAVRPRAAAEAQAVLVRRAVLRAALQNLGLVDGEDRMN